MRGRTRSALSLLVVALVAVPRAGAQPAEPAPAATPRCSIRTPGYAEVGYAVGGTWDARAYVGRAAPSVVHVFRGAVGLRLRGCEGGGVEGRVGVAVHGTSPDHGLGAGVGVEAEVDWPVGRGLLVGVRAAGGGGTALFAEAGVRLRKGVVSLGFDGLYSTGVRGRYEDAPTEVTTAPLHALVGGVDVRLVGKPGYYLVGAGLGLVAFVAIAWIGQGQIDS